MTNDIRKNIMLIESIILDESFKDTQAKFSTSTSSEEVKSYIDKFKELSKRNIIKGQDKDIGFWIKGDWDSFKKFVDSNSTVVTNRQAKAVQKKDSIVVYNDDVKQVVVPLTKEASIQYGKNTAWCTAYTDAPNQFINYFYINKITLFYVLFKDGTKYACAFHQEKPDTIECFDRADRSMSFEKFEEATGITKKVVQEWYNSNKTKIENSRDLNKAPEEIQISTVKDDGFAIELITNPSESVQIAAATQNGYVIERIIDKGIIPSEEVQLAAVTKNYGWVIQLLVDNGIVPSEEAQLAAVTNDGFVIRLIANPSEEVQLAAVKKYMGAIGYIIDKGIKPSEEVQLAAVTKNGGAIGYIIDKGIKPSEEVQLAAVNQNAWAIEHIDNPSEELQLIAVTQYGFAIRDIDNPSEKAQLVAVNQDGYFIEHIDNPSEEVQLAAVKNNGYAIKYIDNPSEEVQLAAVKNNGYAIKYIDNPSEKVQLAAVTRNGDTIEYIVDKGIVPSEQVQLAAVTKNGRAIDYIDNPSEKVKALHKKLWVDKE